MVCARDLNLVQAVAFQNSTKRETDLSIDELFNAVSTIAANHETRPNVSIYSFRRILRGLKISKSSSGYYSVADAALIVGWLVSREQFHSYSEYLQARGKEIYKNFEVMRG